jgi:phosphoglycolate phosphatase
MTEPRQRAILFDLDGTLIDSRPGVMASLHHAMAGMGRPLDPAIPLDWALGPPLAESFRRLLPTAPEDAVATAVRLYREHYAGMAIAGTTVFPGVPAMLAALADRGFRLFVATSKQEGFARQIVDHFGLAERFEGVYGEAMDGARATKQAVIAHVLAAHAIAPPDAVMVGDREHDILAARALGLKTIGVLWGYGSEAELSAAGADSLCLTAKLLPSLVVA